MVAVTIVLVAVMLTLGRWVGNWILSLAVRFFSNQSSIIGLVLGLAALGATLTQWMGIHAFFGAFMVGVVAGSSPHLTKQARESIDSVVSNFLAPLYFASIGLHISFIDNFSLPLVLFVLLAACAGQIGGCFAIARLAGIPARSALAIGLAMNSRGSIEIVFGMMALQENIITEQMLVSLAVMALVTSTMCGYSLRHMSSGLQTDEMFRSLE